MKQIPQSLVYISTLVLSYLFGGSNKNQLRKRSFTKLKEVNISPSKLGKVLL